MQQLALVMGLKRSKRRKNKSSKIKKLRKGIFVLFAYGSIRSLFRHEIHESVSLVESVRLAEMRAAEDGAELPEVGLQMIVIAVDMRLIDSTCEGQKKKN